MTATLSPICGFGQAEPVQGDRAQGGEGRRLEIHAIGQRGEQVARHHVVFGMDRVAAAGAGHPLPNLETFHPATQGNDRARPRNIPAPSAGRDG